MLSARKIERIQEILSRLYPSPPAPLNYRCAFTFLCAVVLSAQTTDGKVNEVTKSLFELASTPLAMSKLSISQVQEIIQPVGLAPQKASYLVGLANKLVTDFNSTVPDTFEELESLPGVGHKTASVVLSHVYEVPAIAVDTHVHRLALRWGLTKESSNVNKVQQDLMRQFPSSAWGTVHLQMIYFGREYCVAKGHEVCNSLQATRCHSLIYYQNATCPICCWIHKKDEELDSYANIPITPSVHGRAKGIVYFDDRTKELSGSPLPTFDLHKRRKHPLLFAIYASG